MLYLLCMQGFSTLFHLWWETSEIAMLTIMNNYLFWKRFAQGKLKTHVSSAKIRIPSPKQILSWSERRLPNSTLIGKIDNAHTVEHDTLRPVSGGLFCERIFGPIATNVCACLRRKGWNEDYCKVCEVQFTKSRLRRYQMGHILLAAPVIHIWALQGGYLANLLGKKNLGIRSIAYGKVMCQTKLWKNTIANKDCSEAFKETKLNNKSNHRNDSSLYALFSMNSRDYLNFLNQLHVPKNVTLSSSKFSKSQGFTKFTRNKTFFC